MWRRRRDRNRDDNPVIEEAPLWHDGGIPIQDPAAFLRWPWRCGRRALRTVYAHPPGVGDGDAAYAGFLIGMFDTPELAAAAVRAHNLLIGGKVKS